uniref:CD99 antigen-like protein 2 n=1 Tax=Cyanistes caeruleus TaxID=156563 RepID=A0A8C0VEZ4_CYACU
MVARLFQSFCDRSRLSSKVAGCPFQFQPDMGGLTNGAAPSHNTYRALCHPHKQECNNPFPPTDSDLADYFDTPVETTTKPTKPTPKPFPRPRKPDNGFWDVIHTTTTKQPKTTRAPHKRNPEKDPMDFDLADALDDKNDRKDIGQPDIRPGEGFSDDDLASIVDGGYSPDKKKGASGNTDNNYSGVAETGTIAGIASGLAMALIGAVSSYISYQQKKFCFSIQRVLLRNLAKTSWKSTERNCECYQMGTGTTDIFPDSGNCICYKLMPLPVESYSPFRFRHLRHERN